MPTQNDVKLGRRLQKSRKDAGLTQEQLADKTNLSVPYIGYLETGLRKPSLKTLKKLANVLGVKVSDLIPY
ncbi:hypothetical protein A2Z22_04760 [Candidatus Woesebacteria bacterium RBG_16_34_12]|uniref:HTH cro/C1-type domain-containing protein n=1 Tax=Candidatus Woesebacteria bacterium RBG_16_34_12 TaxID=1802480 RepID=A0A1F7XAC3_9BACT|nr:MAG: hypothetical protein A2Z22_04760 [Candidatus Woesebacteria bacterium RBG_16_34_12]